MLLLNEEEADKNGMWVYGTYDPDHFYVKQGVPTARPSIEVSTFTLKPNEEIALLNVPKDSKIIIDELLVASSDGSETSLSFIASGEYSVRVEPPFPWKTESFWVKVE